jgi:hypothetical protein
MWDWLVARINRNSGASIRENVNKALCEHAGYIGEYLENLTETRKDVNMSMRAYLPHALPHATQLPQIPRDDIYLLQQLSDFLQDQERSQLHIARILKNISRD